MKRRDVMKLGAAAAGAGLMPGCAAPRLLESLSGSSGAAEFGAVLDQQLAALSQPGFLQRIMALEGAAPRSPETEAKIAEKDALFRRLLGSLLVTQGFRELSPETQLEPAVQDRMWSHMDEVGETVFEVSDMLAALDDRQRAQVQKILRDRPDLPMALGEAIDTRAAGAGISMRRRHQLRKMMSQSGFRLRTSDVGTVIDEYVRKVEKVRSRDDHDATTLEMAKQLGERSFWRHQALLAAQATAPSTAPATSTAAPGATPSNAPPAPSALAPRRKPGQRGLSAGAYLLGIGVVTGGVSLALTEAAEGFVVGVTVGAILVAVGLIVLLVSAIIYANAD